jgi:hypothetical protein
MRATTDGPWIWLNRRALALAVRQGPSVALVLLAMADVESRAPAGSKGAFPASLDEIANACGLSKRTVQTALTVLVKIGLLSITSGCTSRGISIRNRYTLLSILSKNADGNGCQPRGNGCHAHGNGCHPADGNGCHPNKEKEEEGRPPSGPTRPSSKERKIPPSAGSPARLNAAPGPAAPKTDMEQSDTGGVGDTGALEADDYWQRYVRQQLRLAGDGATT